MASPPPKQAARKKRQSLLPSNNSTPAGSPLGPSTKQPAARFNDDAAEKANRRKSAHFSPAQAQAQAVTGTKVPIRNKRLSTVARPVQEPQVSIEVMSNNFEEWMKLATDNKITVTNTWNFALIDYFADLTLLRNGPDDQSINFQKASCTLDGCVKIWTSRVDSVATETGKLLSGLSGGGDGDERDVDDDEDAEDDGEAKATRKAHRAETTLAKSFATLQLKKFDLEFTVDPLFKKTSADFDEGGAMGLLMNHLGVDGRGRVVFDAGDAGVVEEEEEDEDVGDEIVDIAKLREFIPPTEDMADYTISETLGSFRFSADPNDMPDLSTLTIGSSFSAGQHAEGSGTTHDDDEDVFGGDAGGGDGEHDFFGGDDFEMGGGDDAGFDDAGSVDGGQGLGMGSAEDLPFDPRRQARGGELVMAMMGGMNNDDDGMFDYFDKGFGKAWAGHEHWKLRKVSRKDAAAPAAAKGVRKEKTAFEIDFTSSPTAAQLPKTLFAAATRASTMLPAAKTASARRNTRKATSEAKVRREEWLLPDDMHFSSRQLLRLFLKPKFTLRMRRRTAGAVPTNDGELDEAFWAQQAADRADGGGDINDEDGQPAAFDSQFFHDDMDDGADFAFIDDGLGGDDAGGMDDGADDLWAATQGQELKKSRPENVHYAKKAKRVDVKRLKDEIWTGLKIRTAESDTGDESDGPKTPSTDEELAIEAPRTFDSVIQSLRTTYPQEKMSEISTSFCFICLLHLANEEGLKLETARFGDEEEMIEADSTADRVVGELQALKIWKDPSAGRSA